MWRTSNAPLRHGNEVGSRTARPPTRTGSRPSDAPGAGCTWRTTSSPTIAWDSASHSLSRGRRASARPLRLVRLHRCVGAELVLAEATERGGGGPRRQPAEPLSGSPALPGARPPQARGVDGLYASVGGICIANGWLERAEKGYCRGHVRRLQVVLHADGYDVPLTPNARCAPVSPCTRRNRVRS